MPAVRPVSQVLTDIVRNVQEIIRAEIQLAKTQLRDELRSTQPAAVLLGLGLLGAALSTFFLLVCIDEALSLVIPSWAASLVIGAVLAIVAAITLNHGVRRIRHGLQPLPKLSASAKESVEWLRPRSR